MGFGHRVYKNYDPRAKIIKKAADEVLEVTGTNPLLDIALELEKIALEDDYFIDRKLYPNVDFYSGLIYEALGMPMEMFPVLFAIGRTSGWIAQWLEMIDDKEQKIARPRQIYTGSRGPGLRPDRSARLTSSRLDAHDQGRFPRRATAVRCAGAGAGRLEFRADELAEAHREHAGGNEAPALRRPSSRWWPGSSSPVPSAAWPPSTPASTSTATARPRPTQGACAGEPSNRRRARTRSRRLRRALGDR